MGMERYLRCPFYVIYQTQETVFHRISKIRGVWIADETLSGVFDMSSQSK